MAAADLVTASLEEYERRSREYHDRVNRLIGETMRSLQARQAAIRPDLPFGQIRPSGPGLLEQAGRSFAAGIGDLLQTAGGAAQWAGLEGAGRSLEEAGRSISERYGVEAPPFTWRSLLDPRFWTTTVARTLPTTLALIPAAIAGGYLGAAGATALRLGAWGRTILGAIGAGAASRPLESALEAGSTYQEALARGMTEEEADRAADTVFRRNLALSGLDAAQWAAAFAPVPPAVRQFTGRLGSQALGRAAIAAGRVAGAGLPEAVEEYLQEGIQRSAIGEPQPWRLDPQAQQALALGGIFGAGLGGAGEVYTSLRDATVRRLTPDLQQRFEAEKQRFQQSGMAEQQAEVAALDTVAGDPRGAAAAAQAARDIARQLQQAAPEVVDQPVQGAARPNAGGVQAAAPSVVPAPEAAPAQRQLPEPNQTVPSPEPDVQVSALQAQQPQVSERAPEQAAAPPPAQPSAEFAEGDRVAWTDKHGRRLQGEVYRIKGGRIWVRITQSPEGGPNPGLVWPVSRASLTRLEGEQEGGQAGRATNPRQPQPQPVQPPALQPEAQQPAVAVGATVWLPSGEAVTVTDASDASFLRVRNARGTEFQVGRRAVRYEPPQPSQEAPPQPVQQPGEGVRGALGLDTPSGAGAPALPMGPVETPVEAQPLGANLALQEEPSERMGPPTTRTTETVPAGQASVEQPPQGETPLLRQLRRTGAAYRADTRTAAKVVAHPADENAFTVEVERDGNRTYPLVDQRLTLEQAQQAAARILEEAAPAEEASPTAGESVGVPVTAPAQPATQTLGAAPVSPDDVDFQLAVGAHRWNSMNPEERARGIQQEYVQHMRSVWRELSNLAKSPEQQRVAQAEFERYKEQYLAHLRAVLEARSRTASAMVTGPSKFPTKRNQQALEREYRRTQEMQQWERRALAAMRRAVHEARTPEQAADAEWRRLERDILDNIATIRLIDQGDPSQRGMDRSAFVRSIEGRIRRIAASGKVDLAKRALDLVREAQANMSKPVFTERHSIWQVAEKAQARAAARPAPAGQEEIATFEGARVVANREARRTQILFDAKPSEAVRQALRREGWVWSPRNQAWQRSLTANSEESARRILGQYFEPAEAAAPETTGRSEAATPAQGERPALPETAPPEEGVQVQQLPPLKPLATGNRAQALTERGTGVETEYALVETDQLVASHDTGLRPNPAYPAELQPRERSRVASELQVQRIVQQLQPEFLGESPKASEGAPIVGPDAVVESGNGRVIALKRIYEQNHPNAARYREWLVANAERFGIDPEAVRQAKAPVLVRIRRGEVDRLQFVREANEQAVAAMSATEQAVSDARMLTPEMVALFEPGDEGQIVTPANRDFISLFMQQIVGPAERGRYMTAEGALSQEGVNRIRNAIFARAYGDPDVLAKLAEDPDNNVRNITQAMLIAAPRMVELKAGVEQGRLYPLDLSADLAAAVKKLSSLREQGQTVEMYLQQGALFDDGLSQVAKDLLGVLEKYKRSRTKLAAILNTYAQLAQAAGNPNQASLFEEVRPPAKADVLDAAIERVESGGYVGGGALQAALFEAQPAHVSIPQPPAGQEAQAGGQGAADPGAAQESPQAPLREVEERLRQQAQAAREERERRRPEQLGAGVGFPPLSARADDAPHSPYAFSDPEVDARWQASKGVKQPPFTERVRQWWDRFARQATREFEFLPRTAEFAEMRQALLRLRAQKDVTSDRTIRLIDGIVAPLDAQGYDLFSRKVVLDDLRHEADAGRPLPFGFTPDTLRAEAERIERSVEASLSVRQAVEQRRQMWEAVKREYIEAMEAIGFNVRNRLTREDYFRHQVLEYANLKGISGSGRKLRTPSGRGFLRRREGSNLDINSDYLQAEYEVLAQMLMDIEIARAIRTVDERYNIRNRLQRAAAEANLQAIQRKAMQDGDTALVDRLTDFRRRIAIGLDRLRKKAASNDLWRGESGEWEDLVERLEEEHLDIVEALQEDLPFEGGSTAPPETPLPPEVRPLFRFLAELAKRDVEGSQDARMIFKAISERRQWIRDTLGDQYLTWRDLIPEGYTTWQPREGNIFFITDSIPANIANRLLEQGLEQIGISQEDIRRVLAMGGPRREFVVREEIASTLDNLTRPREDSVLHQAGRTLTRGWKVMTLFSPFRFLRYEFRNLTGDLDAVLAGSPSALRKLPQAVRDLAKVFVEHKEMPREMREWFERGGMHSLLRVQELGDLNRLEQFERLMRRKQNLSEQTVGRMWRGYWRAVNLTNDFREAILRYAAYLDYLEQIQRNRGRPDNFGASIPDEIMALSDIRDRAYRLSNELLGAYDQVSAFGQQLREYAFPFWSWVEVNNRRYIQLIKNAVQDGKVAELVGRKLVGTAVRSPFLLMRVGRLALGALALSALMEVWNRTFFPDEEEDLPEDVRAKPHLVFGRNADGSVRYIGQLGALNDFLDWFGLGQARQHVADYLQGRRTLKEIASDMAAGPFNKLVQGFGLTKTAFEAIFGWELYPDIRRPGRIRDRGLHLADSVGLGDLYRKARGYPVRQGRPFSTLLFTLAHPGESAYYHIRDEVSRYMRQLGKATGGFSESERSTALYWLKVALRYGDTRAASRWLEEYVLLGGTRQGLEQSLRSLHPLYGLNEQEQRAFVAQLPFEDLGRLYAALVWYEQVIAGTQSLNLQALPGSSRQGSGTNRTPAVPSVKVPSVKAPSVQAPRPLVKP